MDLLKDFEGPLKFMWRVSNVSILVPHFRVRRVLYSDTIFRQIWSRETVHWNSFVLLFILNILSHMSSTYKTTIMNARVSHPTPAPTPQWGKMTSRAGRAPPPKMGYNCWRHARIYRFPNSGPKYQRLIISSCRQNSSWTHLGIYIYIHLYIVLRWVLDRINID